MIIVTGSVHARPDTLAAVLQASLEHVHRSRTEAISGRGDQRPTLEIYEATRTATGS